MFENPVAFPPPIVLSPQRSLGSTRRGSGDEDLGAVPKFLAEARDADGHAGQATGPARRGGWAAGGADWPGCERAGCSLVGSTGGSNGSLEAAGLNPASAEDHGRA